MLDLSATVIEYAAGLEQLDRRGPALIREIVKPGPTVPVSLRAPRPPARRGHSECGVRRRATTTSVRKRSMRLLPRWILPCQDRGDVRVHEIRTGLWRWTAPPPRVDACRGRAGGLGAGGRLLLLRGARRGRALSTRSSRPRIATGSSRHSTGTSSRPGGPYGCSSPSPTIAGARAELAKRYGGTVDQPAGRRGGGVRGAGTSASSGSRSTGRSSSATS